ncbi:alpha/beta hydrolase [Nocardia callitridis]|uniref:Alpha/beta hydrolase family protein n=1 Tax=Nocardia callitridis TaxID=648753 RepID=A0ABP9JSZ0_9NOCA
MYRLLRCLVCVLALCAPLVPSALGRLPVAAADPAAGVLDVRGLGGRELEVDVYSVAMGRPVTLWMSHPGAGAPALYLLNAVDGGEDGGPWTRRTDVAQFFADKPVNVIVPMGGRASYYTDWQRDDPALGRNKWATFLTEELPPALESRFGMTGRNAVAGLSMSATSALNLAIGAPGRYQAVGAYSGCPRTSDALAEAYVRSQLAVFGADGTNMWGPPGDPAWAANDPMLHAERLRGTALYVSAGSGAPGRHENLDDPGIDGNPLRLVDRAVVGGGMETVIGGCTAGFVDRLHQLGVPVTAVQRPQGTHAWSYWQDDLHDSWALFAPALGV